MSTKAPGLTGGQSASDSVGLMGKTRLRLTTAAKFPRHGAATAGARAAVGWNQARGREIGVYLPPVAPDENWECDTPVVWKVDDETIAELGINPEENVHVCWHQVQAD